MYHSPQTPLDAPTNEAPPSLAPVAWPDDPPVIPLNAPPPWWAWLVGAGAALAVLLSVGVASSERGPAGAAPSPAPVPAEPAQELPDDLDLYSLALEGEARALERLESMPAEVRSVTDVLVLAEGSRARDLRNVRELVQRRDWASDDGARLEISGYARRADTGPETLGLLAVSGGSSGADLIFSVWRSAPKGSVLSMTAAQLLVSPALHAQSSPALRVAVELQRVEDCAAASALTREAERVADRRALRGLARLARREGCGADRRADCFVCLRSSADLARAVRSASRRPGPRL